MKIRTFIAVPLPTEAREALASCQEALGASQARFAKWVHPESIHVTIKFLGNVEEALLPRLNEVIVKAVAGIPPFELKIGALGAFPHAGNARVVWAGLEGNLDALQSLYRAVEDAVVTLGFPPEGRPFAPHLTLARVRETAARADKAQLARALAECPFVGGITIPVNEVLVMRSDLARTGARYTIQHNVPLSPPT